MFLGDHWIGCEPFMPEFQQSGVDAIVGSVGNGSTLRLISDIPGVKLHRGTIPALLLPRYLPRGRRPCARGQGELGHRTPRHPAQSPLTASATAAISSWPASSGVSRLCRASATSSASCTKTSKGTTPYCVKTVAVLNSWGQQRAWGCHMVHHALYQKQNYSYAGGLKPRPAHRLT